MLFTICGVSGAEGFKHGKCLTETEFDLPCAVCLDPLRPTHFWVGDRCSIRYVDTTTDATRLVAGSARSGYADGVGSAAAFRDVNDLLCTRSGGDGSRRLFAVDHGNRRIRTVDVKSGAVTTTTDTTDPNLGFGFGSPGASIGAPRKFTFDRAPSVKPESALYITSDGIVRLDLDTLTATPCPNTEKLNNAWGIDCTARGQLIVSCVTTRSVYLYDPNTGERSLLAGSGVYGPTTRTDGVGQAARFSFPFDLVLVKLDRCVYVCDTGKYLTRITLPSSLFV